MCRSMGWMKIAVVSAVGVYSIRSVVRVNQLVKQVNVPRHSLLDNYNIQPSNNYKQYKDAFKIELPSRFMLLKNTGSVNELFVDDFCRNFFNCKIFSNLEKPILNQLLKLNDKQYLPDDNLLKYNAFKFKTNDKVLAWKVIGRENDQILMRWEFRGVSGTTWFYIPRDENALVFGSSMSIPKEFTSTSEEKIFKTEPKQLYIDAARTLPEDSQLSIKLKNLFIKASAAVIIPIHKTYSKYLLLSTYQKIIKDEDKVDRRKPDTYF